MLDKIQCVGARQARECDLPDLARHDHWAALLAAFPEGAAAAGGEARAARDDDDDARTLEGSL